MRTRQILLDAAKTLLEKHQINEITVQDILNEAGVSRPTFYVYFHDKYDVANAYYYESILKKGVIYDDTCPYEERRLRLVQFCKENAAILLNLLNEQGQDSLLDYLFKEVYHITIPDMEHQYQVKFTENMNYMLRGIWDGQMSCLRYWLEDGCVLDTEQMRDMLIAMEKGPILQYCKNIK